MNLPPRRPLFFPYLLYDYPSHESFCELLEMAQEHADLIEIGIPFSDPVADGPVIQEAAHQVLQRPFDSEKLLQTLQNRTRKIPIALMTYANPVWNYGLEDFCKACKEIDLDALIVPDVPYEESARWHEASSFSGLSWISFVSLFTQEERLKQICQQSEGFLYLVSVAGVTGTKIGGPEFIRTKAEQIRKHTTTPIALGFGIRSVTDTIPYRGLIDAFIIGTKTIEVIRETKSIQAAEKLFRDFYTGLSQGGF